jgi:ferredoxin-NADP reductase
MKLTLMDRVREADDVLSFIFQPDGHLEWTAGQFLHFQLPHSPADDRKTDRYFTVASAAHEGVVRLTTRLSAEQGSTFKKALEALPIGAHVEAGELDGDFVVDDAAGEHVFIAGGIGITPFRAMLLDLEHRRRPLNVILLYSSRGADFIFRSELQALSAAHPELRIHCFVSPQRIDGEAIRRYVPHLERPMFYISGPEPMVEAMGVLLKEMGVPDEHLKQDWFPNYEAE